MSSALDRLDRKTATTETGKTELSRAFRKIAKAKKPNMVELRELAVSAACECVARAEESGDVKSMLDAVKLVSTIAGLTRPSEGDGGGPSSEQRAELARIAQEQLGKPK